MKDKLNQFVDNTIGQFVEVSYKAAIYQCFDLAYAWIFSLGIPKATIQNGSAFEIYTKADNYTREYFEVIPNKLKTIPQGGDLVVWSNKYGKYGHVAIVIEATQTRMKVFEQNNPLGTNAHIQERTYTNVLGFLRPKNVVVPKVPQWLSTLLQERGLTIDNEGDIRALFDRAKKYDDEVSGLREQVKSANEELANKALELSITVEKLGKEERKANELQEQLNKTRGERDKAVWENDKTKIMVETLEEGLSAYETQVSDLKMALKESKEKSVEGLSRWDLFKFLVRW